MMARLRMFIATYHDLSIRGDVETEVFRTLEDAEKSALENVECVWCDFVKIHEIDFDKWEMNHVKTIDSSDVEDDES